jgi:betaine-aldehyde dehydrogenase
VDCIKTNFKPGVPTEMSTTMGPVISKAAEERVLSYIDSGKKEGAQLLYGGKKPQGDEKIKDGFFIEPTIFTNVTTDMKIAREEIFGPVMSVLKWTDETEMLRQVNSTDYGLTASIYTRDVATAQDIVKKVEAGFIWVNQVGRHYLGVPFGGYKESGGGREESFDEMLSFTQTKTVNISLAR